MLNDFKIKSKAVNRVLYENVGIFLLNRILIVTIHFQTRFI